MVSIVPLLSHCIHIFILLFQQGIVHLVHCPTSIILLCTIICPIIPVGLCFLKTIVPRIYLYLPHYSYHCS